MSTMGLIRKAWKNEEGQTILFAALCMAVLMGVLAMAVDVGMMFWAKQTAQTAADAAAITGIRELAYGDYEAMGKADAAANGYTDGSNCVPAGSANCVSVVVQTPASGPYAGSSTAIEAIVTAPRPTFFARMLNIPFMTVSARAVAALGPAHNCIYALGTTGTDIGYGNGTNIDIPDCAVYADSSDPSDMATCGSYGGSGKFTADSINLTGGYVNPASCSSTLDPNPPNTGVPPVGDPLASLTPPTTHTSKTIPSCSGCSTTYSYNGGSGDYNPGTPPSGGGGYNGISINNYSGSSEINTAANGQLIVNGNTTLNLSGNTSVSFQDPNSGQTPSYYFNGSITANESGNAVVNFGSGNYVIDGNTTLGAANFGSGNYVFNGNLTLNGATTFGSGGTYEINGTLSTGNGANLTLGSGTYIIGPNGSLSIGQNGSSSISGAGVTIYLAPGATLNIGNSATVNLTAPTSGTYNGILFYQDRSDSNMADMEGASSSSYTGILYFPDAPMKFGNAANSSYPSSVTIIARSLTFTGSATLHDYAAANHNTPIMSTPHLVE